MPLSDLDMWGKKQNNNNKKWYEWVKPNKCNYNAMFGDFHHIHNVHENCNSNAFTVWINLPKYATFNFNRSCCNLEMRSVTQSGING